MRLSVDKWILTTVKKSNELVDQNKNQSLNSDSGIVINDQSNLIVEEKVTVEQNLFQEDCNTDSECSESNYNSIETLVSNSIKSASKIERASSNQTNKVIIIFYINV
jgi:hypothetical protein